MSALAVEAEGLVKTFGSTRALDGINLQIPLENPGLIWLFPLTFISSAFVPTGNMPAVLKVAAEWNPVTAVADANRELFANTVPATLARW